MRTQIMDLAKDQGLDLNMATLAVRDRHYGSVDE